MVKTSMLKDGPQQRGDDEVGEEDQEAEEDVEMGDGEHLQAQDGTNRLGQSKHLKSRVWFGINEC